MPKLLPALLAFSVLFGCAKSGPKSAGSSASEASEVPKAELLLPAFRKALEADALPVVINQLMGVDASFTKVIAYGRWLEQGKGRDANSLTIHADPYWSAFVNMSIDNPTVYFSRLVLLYMDGELARANYVKLFASYHFSRKNGEHRKFLEYLQARQQEIVRITDGLVERGIARFDRGDKGKAMAYYDGALRIWPKCPRANYEMGLALMVQDLKDATREDRPHVEWFAKTRSYDPFYRFAYQGRKEIAMKMLVVMQEIEPAIRKIGGGEPTVESMRAFAVGCEKLEDWELAAYAWHFLLTMTLTKERGFDLETVAKFTGCLKALGAEGAASAIGGEYARYNELKD